MFKSYFNVALRNLVNSRLYSGINIIGLGVGLAACVLITLFVRDELSFDRQWSNADRLYRVHTTFDIPGREPFVTTLAPGKARAALQGFFDGEVEAVTRFLDTEPVVALGDRVFREEVMYTDPETVDMFDFEVTAGNLRQTLNDNSALALSSSLATKYFGDQDPIGQVLSLTVYELKRDYRVGAVYKDMPHNTAMKMPALAMIDEQDFSAQPYLFDSWFSMNGWTFFTLADGVGIDRVTSRLDDFADANIEIPAAATGGHEVAASEFVHFTTMSIKDIQLNPAGLGEMKPVGSKLTVLIFASIAALILVIACINFMNLATARSTQRAREVALRKVLGARRGQLITQFLGESVLVALAALLVGLALVELVLPVFSQFVEKELSLQYTDGMTLMILLGLVVSVGLVGGVYPALVLSGFRPASVLKANRSAETHGSATLRNLLVVLQFAISISLILATAVIYGQMRYAAQLDPGFAKDQLLIVRGISRQGVSENLDALKSEVLRLSTVVNAAYSAEGPADESESITSITIPGAENDAILVGSQAIDHDFFDTYRIPILSGRDFSTDYAQDVMPDSENAVADETMQGNVIVNASALGRFGFGSPQEALGKVIRMGIGGTDHDPIRADFTLVGVAPDTHFQSLRKTIRPEIYLLNESQYRNMAVRYRGDSREVLAELEEVWRSIVPDVPFEYEFVTDLMAEEFRRESSMATMLGGFSMLAVIIACLGLFGLASFTAERRTKEIGIRKVHGASVLDIVKLLIWQFSKPVLVANVLAWPLASWAMLRWLENFPYRMDSWQLLPLCLLAGLIALSIAWMTVGGNAARVARANPIRALRYE